jgi:RNA polymerase sigma-54 factor
MALSQRLEFRQSQALVMTPQLMQAIKLLQLSTLDLAAYVDAELERNPLLERAPTNPEDPVSLEPEQVNEVGEQTEGIRAGDWLNEGLETSRAAIEQRLDADLSNVFPSEGAETPTASAGSALAPTSEWAAVGSGGRDLDDYDLDNYATAEATLAEHLSGQLALAVSDPAERLIGSHLIDLVDPAGYFSGDLSEIAENLGAPLSQVEHVLSIVQTFEPSGVGGRGLAECLAIQLRDRNRFDPAMQALVAHLDLLAKRDFAALRGICGVDDEDLIDMVGEIRRLNPKPGIAFGASPVQTLVPDVLVRPAPDGGWLVELNSETLPKVLLNQTYYAEVTKAARNPTEKGFLSECFQTATWLVRALDQRARTILKVATEIVRQQDAFFVNGVQHLRPLTLRAIADAIEMHESTVSRVTANKYMATTRGIFELKYFFTASIASSDGGDAHSAEAVRYRIRQLIEAENPEAILSDDTIVEKLRQTGIEIARRTVAKYREALRIPSSVQRRREKQSRRLSA